MGRFIDNENSIFHKWVKKLVNNGGEVTKASYSSSSGDNVCVFKVGKVAFISCVSYQWYNDEAGGTIRGESATGTPWVLPVEFRPVTIVEIKEALNNKRISISTSGKVYCNEVLNGTSLRFSGCYVCQ